MTLLALETSCDETSAAVVRDGVILSNVVSSQIKLHEEYGGVVPELAAREHLKNLLPVAQTALRESGMAASALEAVAATQGPGLAIALLVGFKAAQAAAFALNKPFIGINHHEAHLYSPWIQRATDAASPPVNETRLAAEGRPDACDFPRPLLHEPNDDFSFSGLKTSVRYFIRDHPAWLEDPQKVRDLCASVQAAIVEVLVKKTIRAAKREGVRCVTASGGVTCNSGLRRELEHACRRHGFVLRLADRSLCTDNAGMIGILAERKLLAHMPLPPRDEEVKPGWALA